ncbi:MAG: hypothetical protein ACQEQ4_05250 [Fibrobacterota bacterium]
MHNGTKRDTIELRYEEYVKSFTRNNVPYIHKINVLYDHLQRLILESRGLALSLKMPDTDMEELLLLCRLAFIGYYENINYYNPFSSSVSDETLRKSIRIIQEKEFLKAYDSMIKKRLFKILLHLNTSKAGHTFSKKEKRIFYICRDAAIIDTLRMLATKKNTKKTTPESNSEDALLPPTEESILTELSTVFTVKYLWSFKTLERRNYISTILTNFSISETPLTESVQNYLRERARQAQELKIKGI